LAPSALGSNHPAEASPAGGDSSNRYLIATTLKTAFVPDFPASGETGPVPGLRRSVQGSSVSASEALVGDLLESSADGEAHTRPEGHNQQARRLPRRCSRAIPQSSSPASHPRRSGDQSFRPGDRREWSGFVGPPRAYSVLELSPDGDPSSSSDRLTEYWLQRLVSTGKPDKTPSDGGMHFIIHGIHHTTLTTRSGL